MMLRRTHMRTIPSERGGCLAVLVCLLVVTSALAQESPVEELSSVGDGLETSERIEPDNPTLDVASTDTYFVGAGPEVGHVQPLYPAWR